jgi:hypothetical protein
MEPNSIIDTSNPYYQLYEIYVVRAPFGCDACKEYNGSFSGLHITENDTLEYNLTCNACGKKKMIQYTLEEVRQIGKRYYHDSDPNEWVFELFIALRFYPHLVTSYKKYMGFYKALLSPDKGRFKSACEKLWKYLTIGNQQTQWKQRFFEHERH